MVKWRYKNPSFDCVAKLATRLVSRLELSVRWLLQAVVIAALLFPADAVAQMVPYHGPPEATQVIASKTVILGEAASFTPVVAIYGAGTLTYSISPPLPSGLSLDSGTGEVSGSATILLSATTYTVTATDVWNASDSKSFSLTVGPAISASVLVSSTSLRTNSAASFTPVTASDGTSPISFAVTPSLPSGLSLNASTGAITGTPTLASAVTTYTVTATDSNNVTASGNFDLSVYAAVTATQAVASRTLTRNAAATPFTPVTGTPGLAPLAFSVSPSLPSGLTLSSTTGAISGTPTLASGATTYAVTVTDASAASATGTFSLTVNAAVTATQAVASTTLNQNVAATTFTPVTGSGGTSPRGYSISPSLPAGLTLDASTGAVSGTATVGSSLTTYTVTVADANGGTATATFNLTVRAALAATQAIASKGLTINKAVTSFIPVTGSGGTTPYVYTISPALPSGLSFSTSTGAITGTPTFTSAATDYTVTVTDAASATATATFNLTVNSVPVATRAIATVGYTINAPAGPFTPVTATGGTAPLVFSISPAFSVGGLSYNSATGAITGTPTQTKVTTTYTVTVTDAFGAAASSNFNLAVNSSVTATQAIASKTLVQNDAATSFTPVTYTGGSWSVSYSVAPALPAGLSMSTSGAITGTPTSTSSATTYTVSVVDVYGSTGTATFSLTVIPFVSGQSIGSKELTVSKNTAFVPVSGVNGTSPYTYSISPALPAGLAMPSATGQVAGTPTVASSASTYTVTVTDSKGVTATNTFSLTVNAAVTATQAVATKSLTLNLAATSFTPVIGSGGTGSLTYSISPALPAGLTISASTGEISGTPTATKTATTYTVTVTDANSAIATASYTLIVNSAPTATVAVASKSLTQGTAASFTPVTGAGGTTPLAYSVTPALPDGLTLSTSTGAITGTPTTTQSASSYIVSITDANGAVATGAFSLGIFSPPTATQVIASKTVTQGRAASFTPVTGAGGAAPVVYSVLPSLPSGLSLSTSTGAITGTPGSTSALATYTVKVTDANGVNATATFNMNGTLPPTLTRNFTSKAMTQGTAVTPFTIVSATNGASPIVFTISPALPAGVVIDASTGAITGTPTATMAATTYTVTVTDANGAATTSSTFQLTVNAPVTATQAIASKVLTQGKAVTSFAPVTGANGTPSPLYTFTISPALPTGLSMSSSFGTITGTASAAASDAIYTVTVTDANGSAATATFRLILNASVTATQAVASQTLTLNTAATPFTPVTGTGGTTPFAYTISPTLPAGVALDASTGAITGTPTVTSNTTTYTVTITDANAATGTNTFTLKVNAVVTATQAVASKALTQNRAATSFTPVTGANGTAPLAFSISSALPAGLSLSSSTGAITGTPTDISAAATYTVTVTDATGVTATANFSLTVNAALTATQAIASRETTVSKVVTSFTPVTGGDGTPAYVYSISPALPVGMAMSASTGAITGTPTGTKVATTHTVTVTDANAATATGTFSLTVNSAPTATVAVASKTLSQNVAATSFTPVTGGAGTAPFVYTVSPTLPTGLTMASATGAITGTPTLTSARATFTVTITDASSATATATFNLTVAVGVSATQAVASNILTQNKAAVSFTPVTGTGGTAPFAYSVSPALPSGLTMASATGAITGTATVASAATTYTVTVTDANSTTATATLNLTVNSAVTATQAIATKEQTVSRASTPFTPVTGANGTAPLAYTVSPTLPTGLTMASATGEISGTPAATVVLTTYTVTVTDANSATATATFTQRVNSAPTATRNLTAKTLTQGAAITSLTPVTGTNGANPLAYTISPALPAGVVIDAATGAITGTPTATSTATSYAVQVTDANGAAATGATFTLTVNAPVTATQAIAAKVLTETKAVTSFTPVTGGSGTTPYIFSVSPTLPAGLSFSTSTGAITGTPSMATSDATYTVTVTDANSATETATFSLSVNAAVTATQAVASKALTQNVAATSFTPVTGGGGTNPLAYSVSPALPAGLTLSSSTGEITGTPTVASAAATYTVTVTDANSATATTSFSLTVASALTATQAVAAKVLTQNVATTSFTPVTGAGGTSPLAYSVSPTLPAGLSLSSSTGAITGTPTVASSAATYTVTVTDANSGTATATFSLTVNVTVTATQAVASQVLTRNAVATSFTPVTGAGGTSPLAYSVAPTLPAGLTLSSSTGAITGTPTIASSAATYTVTVTDANSATATATFSLTVNAAVTATQAVASRALTQNAVATSFTPVTGAGGTSPLVYSVSPTLPAGLSLSSSTGAITGTPTVASSAATYTVTITDANSATANAAFSLTVNAAVTATQAVASKVLTHNAAATSFTPVTGAGGTSPLAYSVSPTLPTGLTLSSSTGAITGTPSAILGATTYTVTVTDANAATATSTFSLSVISAVSATQSVASKTLTQNTAAATFTPVTGAGGTAPYGYSVSPSLPAGLSLSSSSGAITGTPTVASSTATYTVTVTDANSTTSATFSLTVNSAVTATQAVASKILTQNFATTSFTPVTVSGGAGPFGYSVSPSLPAGLSMNPATGVVSGSPTASSPTATYSVTIIDANGAVVTATFSMAVNTPVTSTQAVASKALTQNLAAVAFTPVTGGGGASPYAYSVSPSLPAGLSLSSSTGAITGTPTVVSSAATYSVTVTDANNATASSTFSLSVEAPLLPPVVSAVTPSIGSVTGGTSVTITGGNFTGVTGLTIGGVAATNVTRVSDTVLSATTPAGSAGAASVVVTTAAGQNSANTLFAYAASLTATIALPFNYLEQNQPVTPFTPVLGVDGVAPLTYGATALPSGLSIDPQTGVISGTPLVSVFSTYTILVRDAGNAAVSQKTAISIWSPVAAATQISSVSLTQGLNVAPFVPVTGSGGRAPYTYSAAGLPAGLSLAPSTGEVSGTPTSPAASTTYTILVTDALGYAASSGFTALVNPPVALTPGAGALAGGTIGAPYAQTLTPSGGVGPYTLSLTSGALPAGLSLVGNTLSGTPTTAGSAAFSITATDTTPGGPVSVTRAYTLAIAGAPSVTAVSPASDFTYGGATITISGAHFLGATSVTIGGTAATNVVVNTAGSITATVPTGVAGSASVVVTTGGGASSANALFTFIVPTPTPNPPAGPLTAGAIGVSYLQTLVATGGTAPYRTSLTAGVLPPGMTLANNVLSGTPTTAGLYTFTIATLDSTTPPISIPSPYTLTIAGAPTLAAVTPSVGPATGGTQVTITGTNLLGVTGLTIGGVPATGVSVLSATSLSAIVPAGAVGSARIVVQTGGGASAEAVAFTYTQPVLVANPSAGALMAGAVGTPYSQPLSAAGGAAPYASALAAGSSLPPGLTLAANSLSGVATRAGQYAFTITTTDSSSPTRSTLDTSYTLAISGAPSLITISPATGTAAGGTPVTLTGTHFLGATGVTIGGVAASNVTVIDANTITATTPARPAGAASVVVTTVGGANAPNAAFAYTAVLTAAQAIPARTLTQNLAATAFIPVTGAGGVGALAYSVLPALPAGLTLSTTTGAITGTPTLASQAAAYTVMITDADGAAATASFSLGVTSALTATQAVASRTLTANSPAAAFTPVTGAGGNGALTYSVSPALPAGLTLSAATGMLTGTPTRISAATTYTVTIVDSGSATARATFSLAVSAASSSLVLSATPSGPAASRSYLLTANVTPANATGVVTFKDGASILGTSTLSNGTATFTTGSLSVSAHSLSALYAGDTVFGASTSAPVVVTPARPNPADDANVRGIVVSQVAAVLSSAQQATTSVQQRLETLHGEDVPAFTNGLSVSVRERQASALEERVAMERNLLAYGSLRNPATPDPFQRMLNGKELAPAPFGAPASGKANWQDYSAWTAGSIIIGGQSYTGQISQNRFTIAGVTAGLDTRLRDNLKAGFAVSLSSDRTKINNDSASNNGHSVTGTAYASFQATQNIFIDGLIGYGRLSFSSSRLDANAGSTITGARSGSVLFGSLLASYEQRNGAFKYAPYGGLDMIAGTLDAYTESGAADWILSYAATSITGQGLILGLRAQYDIATPWGTLSPTARVQFRHGLSGPVTQTLSYAADPSASYALSVTGSGQNTLATALGLRLATPAGPTGQVEYTNNASFSGHQSNGLRGTMMAPF